MNFTLIVKLINRLARQRYLSPEAPTETWMRFESSKSVIFQGQNLVSLKFGIVPKKSHIIEMAPILKNRQALTAWNVGGVKCFCKFSSSPLFLKCWISLETWQVAPYGEQRNCNHSASSKENLLGAVPFLSNFEIWTIIQKRPNQAYICFWKSICLK